MTGRSDQGGAPPAGWRAERVEGAGELDAIAALESAAFQRAVSRAGLERLMASDAFRLYVVRTPTRPVAAFCACSVVADEIHIITIAVSPECQGQGMGTFLMRHVLAEAAAAGAGRATLEVRESNLAARKLYERLGFSIAAIRPKYYESPQEDGLILWRVAGP